MSETKPSNVTYFERMMKSYDYEIGQLRRRIETLEDRRSAASRDYNNARLKEGASPPESQTSPTSSNTTHPEAV